MTFFFVFLRNEGIFVATLGVKGGEGEWGGRKGEEGGLDPTVILTLSVVRGNLSMDVTP